MIATGTTARGRRGFTLVELLVVITGVTLAMGLAVALIHSLLKLDRAARAHMAETTTLGRLAHQFRQDVRASVKADRAGGEDGPTRLELSMPKGRTVVYEAKPGALGRIERRGTEVERREMFRLIRGRTPRLDTRSDGDDVWVSVVLADVPEPDASDPGSGPSRSARIEALLGKDRRLATRGGRTQ